MKQIKGRDIRPELRSEEYISRKDRDQMRSTLHVTIERCMTVKTLKVIKKRREEVKKIVYDRNQASTESGIRSIIRDIRHFTSITGFNLSFPFYSQMNDEGLISTSDSLRHIISRISIHLNFASCHSTGPLSISDGFRYLTSITSLDLSFALCSHMKDEGLISISSNCLRHLTSLSSITLDFSNCASITNAGLISISNCLWSLISLISMRLNFSNCSLMNDEELRSIINCLWNLIPRQSISFDFSFCLSIWYKTRKMTHQELKSLESLKTLQLK